jgi:ABC-type phosphate transport system substrate-binding protein
MRKPLSISPAFFLAVVVWALSSAPPRTAAAGLISVKESTDIAVVVNAKNPAENLTLGELTKVLLGEQSKWKDNTKVVVILRPPGTRERTVLLEKVLHMTEQQFKQSWMAALFRGEVEGEPFTAPSNGTASNYLDVYPGGIAFMPGTTVRADLKVLKVNGRLPGESDYPVK